MTLPEFPEQGSTESAAPQRRPPLKFEPMLVPRLRAAQAALNARFADLAPAIQHDPAATARTIEECARQFAAIRHIETIWLHPMLAQAVAGDPGARGQIMELRLIGLMLARRLLRCFDDLMQAVRAEVYVADTTAQVTAALFRYARHSDQALYPLYELIGEQRQDTAQVA
jgi:hypothetical protein